MATSSTSTSSATSERVCLQLVGLISGGKDSIYNLLEAVRRGHTIIALANLYPAPTTPATTTPAAPVPAASPAVPAAAQAATPRADASSAHESAATSLPGAPASVDAELPQELDSFMIQTVGHNVVPAIAEAMGLPLLRRQTHGKALQAGLYYPADDAAAHLQVASTPAAGAAAASPAPAAGGRSATVSAGGLGSAATVTAAETDEVEDLYELLRDVKARFPGVTGVACGAILSSYQRLRVETVCARLNLTPVAFLWQRRQDTLLQDMIVSRMGAVLVKVAACGLSTRMLGKSIAVLQPALLEAVSAWYATANVPRDRIRQGQCNLFSPTARLCIPCRLHLHTYRRMFHRMPRISCCLPPLHSSGDDSVPIRAGRVASTSL